MRNLVDYEVLSVIGTGTFGTCFKVREKTTNEIFAWKAMNYDELSESKKESLFAEINLLRQLKHPNIVEYFDHIVNKETKTIFIVMEYCEGGDLSQLITKYKSEHYRFEEHYIWRVLYQICKALQVCHNKMSEGSVLHRDIKPANVFLDKNGNVKLGDFGLARILRKNETFAETFVGTPYYMSPELVKGRKYDRKSDIWAVGCLIYEMCALKPPFMGHKFEQLSKNITEGNFNRIPDVYSSDLYDIISFMLEIDNGIRPNIEIILRNPILVRNISGSNCEFPKLIPYTNQGLCKKLYFPTFSPNPELSSTTVSRVLSNSASNMTTINLKKDLLGSIEYNSILKLSTSKLNNLQHELLYETITQNNKEIDPDFITKNVFDDALKSRLQSIRAHESLLKQKEADLELKEKMFAEKETRLILKEKLLEEKFKRDIQHPFNNKFKQSKNCNLRKSHKTNDDTYCSIEPNDSFAIPTVAKLDLAVMPPPKSFARKVSFQSPQKFKKYNIENIPPNISSKLDGNTINTINTHKSDSEDSKKSSKLNLKSSTSSKNSDNSDNSNQKRKSIISSFFGLNIIQKHKQKDVVKNENCEVTLDAVESSNLAQIWTSENKKAAFELLAAMNGSSTNNENNFQKSRRIRSHRSLRIPRQDKRHILL